MGLAYKFDWSVLWREALRRMDAGRIWLDFAVGGFLSLGSLLFLLGVFLGTMRAPWKRLRLVSTIYVESLSERSLPCPALLLVLCRSMIFGRPFSFQDQRHFSGLNYYCLRSYGLGLFTASRVAEHVRAGFASIGQGQYQAVLSTGMTQWQMYWHVMIPHALRLVIPPLQRNSSRSLKLFGGMNHRLWPRPLFMSYKIDSDTFHGLEATTGAMFCLPCPGNGWW